MYGNTLRTIESISIEECNVIAFYFYNLCNAIESFEHYDEFQTLFYRLVDRFGCRQHTEKVVSAYIKKLIGEKKLVPFEAGNNYTHPFNYSDMPEYNFKSDKYIASKCTGFITDSLFSIDFCRCIFTGGSECFATIAALSLFYDGANSDDPVEIPETIRIPDAIMRAVNNFHQAAFLQKALDLSDDELELLLFLYRIHTIMPLQNICTVLTRNDDEIELTVYAKCLNVSLQKIKSLLSVDGKLVAYGFADTDGDMSDHSIDCLYSGTLDTFFANILKQEPLGDTFGLDTYAVKKESSHLALQFLNNNYPAHILLYGSPGAGKTEFAKSLVKASGRKFFLYKNEMEIMNDGAENRVLYRLNCLLSIKKEDSVIVIDEAENIVKTSETMFGVAIQIPQKGIVNKMLEKNVNKVIWIVNHTNSLDESTLRRFTYSIKFTEIPQTMLQSIAHTKLSTMEMSKSLLSRLVDLCGSYRVTGASIDNMITTLQSINYRNATEEKIISDVKNVLEANSELLYGKSLLHKKMHKTYEPAVLNTDMSPELIIEMLRNAASSDECSGESGIRLLFYGLSGTGKTAFAHYIAEMLHKKLIVKTASDILGKYVGENEQHIKQAFAEADTDKALLLFDEADAFFSSRLNAQHGWERTMVNEFLARMEAFEGIVICTTNLKELMDPAMQRRFHIMTEFKALPPEGVSVLLKRYFEQYTFDDESVKKLTAWDSIVPGDFGSLYGRIRFMLRTAVSEEYIIGELIKMQQEKTVNKLIGFSAR